MFKPTYGIPANFLAELYASTLIYFAIFKLCTPIDSWIDWFQILHGVLLTRPVECHYLVLSPQSQEEGFESVPEPYLCCWE